MVSEDERHYKCSRVTEVNQSHTYTTRGRYATRHTSTPNLPTPDRKELNLAETSQKTLDPEGTQNNSEVLGCMVESLRKRRVRQKETGEGVPNQDSGVGSLKDVRFDVKSHIEDPWV